MKSRDLLTIDIVTVHYDIQLAHQNRATDLKIYFNFTISDLFAERRISLPPSVMMIGQCYSVNNSSR